ncbi:Uncharacterised protein [Vibrio cholerae]|nr:Uncharacterised protein [Vibrio cholerae]
MTIPPLHHGIDGTSVDRVRLTHRNGERHTVYNVQYRNGNNKGTEEPVSHVNMRCFTFY